MVRVAVGESIRRFATRSARVLPALGRLLVAAALDAELDVGRRLGLVVVPAPWALDHMVAFLSVRGHLVRWRGCAGSPSNALLPRPEFPCRRRRGVPLAPEQTRLRVLLGLRPAAAPSLGGRALLGKDRPVEVPEVLAVDDHLLPKVGQLPCDRVAVQVEGGQRDDPREARDDVLSAELVLAQVQGAQFPALLEMGDARGIRQDVLGQVQRGEVGQVREALHQSDGVVAQVQLHERREASEALDPRERVLLKKEAAEFGQVVESLDPGEPVGVKPQRGEIHVFVEILDRPVALEVEVKRVVQRRGGVPPVLDGDPLQLLLGHDAFIEVCV